MTMYEGNIWEVRIRDHKTMRCWSAYVGAPTLREANEIAQQHWGDKIYSVQEDYARVFIKS